MIYSLLVLFLIVMVASAVLQSVAIGSVGGVLLVIFLIVLLTGRV